MKTEKVWDPFVRIFHWALVLSILSQFITADSFINIHAKVGYFIIILVLARIIWGFIGTRHARFSDFVYAPKDILGYFKGLLNRNAKSYVGHNPAGGAMVIALLLFLLLTALAGLKTYGTLGKGPLAHSSSKIVTHAYADDDHDEASDADHGHATGQSDARKNFRFWRGIHYTLIDISIVLICLHILGVIASSYVHKENLILSMITGIKKIKE